MRKRLFTVIIIFAVVACKSKEKPLPVNQMKVIVWDLMKSDEWFNALNVKDSTARIKKENFRLYQQVFLIHGITRERFYKSYEYYEAHPGPMKELLDSVDAYSNREREKLYKENYGQKKK